MIKDRRKAKELMRNMGHRKVSNVEMRETMVKEGLNDKEIVDILDELIKEQLGTYSGSIGINKENLEVVMVEMLKAKMGPDRMWQYLEQFGVPTLLRVQLLKEIRDKLEPTKLICTMCGKDLGALTKKDRKCPSCDYAIIKIFRDTKVKEGQLTKDQVIEDLVHAKEFTEEEKDMIR